MPGGGDGGCHESLTPPFDCCSPYSVGSAAYEERGEVKQALKSVSIRGNMLCFSAAVQLLRLGWQFDDYIRNHTHTHAHTGIIGSLPEGEGPEEGQSPR